MLENMCDEVSAIMVDHLDMQSVGALATVINKKVKDVYDIRGRKCSNNFINKLGPNRRLKCRMLKEDSHLCPPCIRHSIDELEVTVMTLSCGFTDEEMEF